MDKYGKSIRKNQVQNEQRLVDERLEEMLRMNNDLRYPIGPYEPNSQLTEEDREALIRDVETQPSLLRAIVEPLTSEQLETPYRPGGWTVRQVIHHLADNNMNAYIRFKRGLTEYAPTSPPYREDLWAELPDYRLLSIDESLVLLSALHKRFAVLLSSLESQEFCRTLSHSVLGQTTLDAALHRFVWHNRHHIAQITSLLDRMGWTMATWENKRGLRLNESLSYDSLIERILRWATERDDIRLAVIIGSRARVDTPADMWSDLDLLLFTTDPATYLSEPSWLTEIGVYHLTFLEPTAVGEFVERRVLFDDGLDVDFIPLPMNVIQSSAVPELSAVLQRGYRVLVDKEDLSPQLADLVGRTNSEDSISQHLSEASFLHLINDFLYHAVWSAKKLGRGELWTAKLCCDGFMKRQLLQIIEWHHQTSAGVVDTWHEGRFLDSWADPDVLNDVQQAFALYDVDSVWTALHATVAVFGSLGTELARRSGYEYPTAAHEYVVGLLQEYRETVNLVTVANHTTPSQLERTGYLHHVEVNVSNLEKSAQFWGWLLEQLGYQLYQEWSDGRSWKKGDTYLVFVQTMQNFLDVGYHRKRTGLNHLAFHAESTEQVDELTQLLRARRVPILYESSHPFAGGPEHYAVFFEDPDRIKVEIVALD